MAGSFQLVCEASDVPGREAYRGHLYFVVRPGVQAGSTEKALRADCESVATALRTHLGIGHPRFAEYFAELLDTARVGLLGEAANIGDATITLNEFKIRLVRSIGPEVRKKYLNDLGTTAAWWAFGFIVVGTVAVILKMYLPKTGALPSSSPNSAPDIDYYSLLRNYAWTVRAFLSPITSTALDSWSGFQRRAPSPTTTLIAGGTSSLSRTTPAQLRTPTLTIHSVSPLAVRAQPPIPSAFSVAMVYSTTETGRFLSAQGTTVPNWEDS